MEQIGAKGNTLSRSLEPPDTANGYTSWPHLSIVPSLKESGRVIGGHQSPRNLPTPAALAGIQQLELIDIPPGLPCGFPGKDLPN